MIFIIFFCCVVGLQLNQREVYSVKVLQVADTSSSASQNEIAEALKKAFLHSKGPGKHYNLALPGGRSLSLIAMALRKAIKNAHIRSHLQVYQIDERLFNDKNAPVIQECLNALHLSQHQLHIFQTTDDIDYGVSAYATRVPLFHAVILGVGEDGHLAGIFPNHESTKISDYGYYHDSPKPPNGRMTAGFDVLLDSKLLIGLFLGRSKWDVLEYMLSSEESMIQYPAMVLKHHINSLIITDSPKSAYNDEL